MKKAISLLLAVLLLVGGLAACGRKPEEPTGQSGKPLHIVTTIFPVYDWVRNILGDNPGGAEVTLLLDNGVDLHSYQPTAEDILKISTCDVFVYVGGESDEWTEDVLAKATNKSLIAIDLLANLGDAVKEEEVVEGMQADEHDHDHEEHDDHEDEEHEEHEEHEEDEEKEYDEHVWLSLKNAEALCGIITEALKSVDPENASVYSVNDFAYRGKLRALDKDYQAAVSGAKIKTVLFGDRFPFRYLVDDYGLAYYAAFVGCSAESEASFETIVFLANKVDELGLHTVLTIEGADHRIAETVVRNTKTKEQKILTMDSMQGSTSNDVKNGKTYLSIMQANLDVLKEALQ